MPRAIFRSAPLACLLLLSACGPAGVVANSVMKETQGRNASDIERDIKKAYETSPALRDVKVSVAMNNVWQNAFQTHYAVLLAGTVPDDEARKAATVTARQIIGADEKAIAIADQMRLAPRPVKAD